MRTCGIDQSFTKSAVVILLDGNLEYFNVFTTDKNDDIFYRCWKITKDICEFVVMIKPDYVNIEGLSFASFGDATRNLSGLQFSIVSNLRYNYGIDTVNIISPMTLKKAATNSGKAKKPEMIAALPENVLTTFKESGYKRSNGLEDLADAYHLAKYVKEEK